MTKSGAVFVEAPARLHLGLIDLRGDLGRRFGGTGLTIRTPSLLLEARPAPELTATGEEADRLLFFARRFLDHYGIDDGARLRLIRAIPAHMGLGSGTQIALATARALAALHGLHADSATLARAVGRARRSAIGTWAFEHGGFILEGGRRTDGDEPGPLLLRHELPDSWRCVIVVPHGVQGLSDQAEEQAFSTLPAPSAEIVGEISRLVLMMLLPSLVEEDLDGFGLAVTAMQRLVGEVFRSAQGSPFAHPLVIEAIEELLAGGAAGAGQSSWGPAVYGFANGDPAARALARRVEARLAGRGTVITTAFDNDGARCWQGSGVAVARG
ncbi:MAG: beta-ribofuranosylaminobenzene 5'-phosphate synthase family protein [Longimicrobiales bacterium]